MHETMNVKFINAKQAKEVYQYRNIKRKLYKTNAAIWYNKTCSTVCQRLPVQEKSETPDDELPEARNM